MRVNDTVLRAKLVCIYQIGFTRNPATTSCRLSSEPHISGCFVFQYDRRRMKLWNSYSDFIVSRSKRIEKTSVNDQRPRTSTEFFSSRHGARNKADGPNT